MDIEERFREIVVVHLGVKADKVTEQASFIDDLGADSLDGFELMMAAEEEFGITIDDNVWKKTYTVGEAVRLISKAVE